MIQETYRSKNYKPELVTGKYVRCEGRKGGYTFTVYETASNRRTGKAGHGFTLREWTTNGEEIPEAVRVKAICSKSTELWEYL